MARRLALLVLIAVTGVTLAGCDSAFQRASAAATVGDTRISLGAVEGEVRWLANNVPDATRLQQENQLDILTRHVVESRVRHALIQTAAAREGLEADAESMALDLGRRVAAEPERARAPSS